MPYYNQGMNHIIIHILISEYKMYQNLNCDKE